MCCAICNCATIGNRVRWKKEKKLKKKKKAERRERMKPLVQPLRGKPPVAEGVAHSRGPDDAVPDAVDVVVQDGKQDEENAVEQPELVEMVEEFSDAPELDNH